MASERPQEPAGQADPKPAAPPATPASEPALWPSRLAAAAAATHEWVARPRVRLSLTGAVLLLVAGLLMTNSVWTLPLVIVGVVMVVIAWMGHRLDGRFTIQWGQDGTQLAFRATVKPARPALETPIEASSGSHEWVLGDEPKAAPAEVIDGEAHTVEIDVAELKALIAAVETAADEPVPTEPVPAETSPQDIRIRRMPHHAARSAELAD